MKYAINFIWHHFRIFYGIFLDDRSTKKPSFKGYKLNQPNPKYYGGAEDDFNDQVKVHHFLVFSKSTNLVMKLSMLFYEKNVFAWKFRCHVYFFFFANWCILMTP